MVYREAIPGYTPPVIHPPWAIPGYTPPVIHYLRYMPGMHHLYIHHLGYMPGMHHLYTLWYTHHGRKSTLRRVVPVLLVLRD